MDEHDPKLALVKMILPDLVKPAAKELGVGLGHIAEFLMLITLPFQYVTKTVKLRFAKRMERVADRIEAQPSEKRVEIPSSIGHPIVQQLLIETDDDLAAMYENLLVAAASQDTADRVHPSFIRCVQNLAPDEAVLIDYLKNQKTVPYLRFRYQFTDTEWLDQTPALTGIENKIQLGKPENLPAYLQNLVGLGILEKGSGSLADTNAWYSDLETTYQPVVNELIEKGHGGKKCDVTAERGYFNITAYGRLFFAAVTK